MAKIKEKMVDPYEDFFHF